MTTTSKTEIYVKSADILERESKASTGYLYGKSITVNPKWKPLCVVFLILGSLCLAIAACGLGAGSISRLSQTQSLICIFVGGISGTGFLSFGIVGIVKIDKLVPRKNEATECKGQICIKTEIVGYIGNSSQQQFWRQYLRDITLEDDAPLPFAADDFFVEFHLFNISTQLKSLDLPSPLHLPGALFKSKKEGDTIRLRYKDHLVELTINQQNNEFKYSKGTFEEVFADQIAYLKMFNDPDIAFLGKSNPYWFYRLGDKGAIYKLEIDRSEDDYTLSHLIEAAPDEFRPQVKPERALGDMLLPKHGKEVIFLIDFLRFQSQDFDIVINEKFLIIYGRFEDRPLTSLIGETDTDPSLNTSGEALYVCRWDSEECFRELSLEEMKELLNKSRFLFANNVLQINVPLK